MKKQLIKRRELINLLLSILFFIIALITYFGLTPGDVALRQITIGTFSDSFWNVQNGNSYKILNAAIEKFEKKHPDVEVNFVSGIQKKDYSEWLVEKILKEDAPDVFFILPEEFNELSEIGALTNLSPFIYKEEDFDQNFYTSAYSYGTYRNAQYALPFECAPKLMFVNQTLLTKEGISIPDVNWTWDDFYSICKQVTKDTNQDNIVDQYGVYGYSWQDAFNSNDIELFDSSGTECMLDNPNVTESLKFIERLQGITPDVTKRDYDLGHVAFQPMSFSEFRAYQPYPLSIKKYSNFEWSCIPMPSGINGKNISTLECLQLGINSKSKKKALAWEFLKTMTTDEEIQKLIFDYSEGVSVLRSVTESDQTLGNLIEASNSNLTQEILSNAVEDAVVTPRFREYDLAMMQVDIAVKDILNNNSNIDMELITYNRSINKSLKNKLIK